MGVPKLNKLLLEKCSQKSIYSIHLESLYGKTVVVDISIYLYKFLSEGNFMEQVYLFMSLFKYYMIKPIFIFDGKPPSEKHAILKKRRDEKQQACKEYERLQQLLQSTTEEHKEDITIQLNVLKKRMIRVTWTQIDQTIELINAFGFTYYLAPNEADQLCVYLNHTKQVYAVISDDMDMIIYGCSLVIRNINLLKHEAILYDTENIYTELKLSRETLVQIVVLSGTDYKITSNIMTNNIKRAYTYYITYLDESTNDTFYEWLEKKDIIQITDFSNVCEMFDIDKYKNELADFCKNNMKPNPKFNISTIKDIMRAYNFIFL